MTAPPTAPTPPLQVLVVDDELSSREVLSLCVEQLGHTAWTAPDLPRALAIAEAEVMDLALVDLRLGTHSGLELMSRLREQSPWLRVAVITAHGSIETAVEAIRQDAMDYLTKPVTPERLETLIRQIATVRDLERGLETLREEMDESTPPPALRSNDPRMLEVFDTAQQASTSDATILIRGESGTGKGVLARAIHGWSGRRKAPFATVSAPSLSRELLESELFGHVKGAFTGAVRSRPGRISRTAGGTLFLDEIGALPPSLQPKLLRVLQDRSYERVGGDQTVKAEVRWIAATNRDLERAVQEEEFREDLYYRLRVIEIWIPPLRERPQDILPLAEHFLTFFGARYGRTGLHFSEGARESIQERDWPGNIRELQNAVERAVILGKGTQIPAAALPGARPGRGGGKAKGTPLITLDEAERRHIAGVLEATGSTREAARLLGVSTTTLWRRRRKHEL